MHFQKKIIIWITGFLVLFLLLHVVLNYWLNNNLPKRIFENNKTPYEIAYKDLKISLWNTSIKATDISIIPKVKDEKSSTYRGVYSKIDSISITEFKVWDLLFNDKIKAESIIISNPEVVLYKSKEADVNNPKKIKSEITEPFQKIIVVSTIVLTNGKFKILNLKNNKPILSANNIDFKMNGIITSDDILKDKIPVWFQKYSLNCSSFYYKLNPFYVLTARELITSDTSLNIKNLSLTPVYTRRQFVQKIVKEKDLFNLKIDAINFKQMKWGFENEKFFFSTNAIVMDKLFANIYRNKIPADDLSKKHLYNKLLREIPFQFNVNTLQINNSQLVYEEEINFKKGPGILTFDEFNLIASNIQNGFNQKKIKDLKIKINCQFMKTSPLKVNWTFNVLDKKDRFNINGSIFNFNSQKITPFLKPHTNVVTHGVLKEVRFNFNGNDNFANGTFGLNYDNLKVTVFKTKKPQEISKLKTALGNLLIKNDSENKTKYETIEVERIPEKSFFNFLWRCIGEGLKKSVL